MDVVVVVVQDEDVFRLEVSRVGLGHREEALCAASSRRQLFAGHLRLIVYVPTTTRGTGTLPPRLIFRPAAAIILTIKADIENMR